jgi:hypothetical protein
VNAASGTISPRALRTRSFDVVGTTMLAVGLHDHAAHLRAAA